MKAYIQHRHKDSGKMVLQALVPFMMLKDHALFTCKANPLYNGNAKKLAEENVAYYQRRIDNSRIRDIQKFIISSILEERNNISLATLFPSSMIIALPIEDEDILKNEEEIEISFDNNVFIVDGQHRLMAMVLLYESIIKGNYPVSENTEYVRRYLEDYKFNCTVLVNFDLWEQGQVFINVNFKQKPVNKSLYYEVFGSEYRENVPDDKRNKIYLAHCLVKELNTNEYSPFYGKVKMLGTGRGYISQAFIVEAILLFFRVYGIWWKSPADDSVSEEDYNLYCAELISYFKAVKDSFKSYWPKDVDPKATIICKTTAVGALLRLMSYIHSNEDFDFDDDLKDTKRGEICVAYCNHVRQILKPIEEYAETLFGKKSEFAKASGKGWENRMYNRFVAIINKDKQITVKEDEIEISSVTMPNKKTIIDLDDISEQLQDYFWLNEDSELSTLAHHYEFDSLSDVKIISAEYNEGSLKLCVSFNSSVVLYIDNEDESGMSQVFPTTVKFEMVDESGEWKLQLESVRSNFDTRDY